MVVISAFLFLIPIEAHGQNVPASSSNYMYFNKWGISFEYPTQWKEHPANRVAMMKDYIAAELHKIPNDPYARELVEFTMITAPSEEAVLLVSKITAIKPMQVEDLLIERKQVYEDAKLAGDVTKINHVKQTTIANLLAVEEDVERSNGGRGRTVKVIFETAIFELSLVVNNGELFSNYSNYLDHIISTFAVKTKRSISNNEPKTSTDEEGQGVLDFMPHELLPANTRSENIDIRVRLEPAKDPNILSVSAPNKEYKIEVVLKMDEKGNFAGVEPLHWSKGAIHEMAENISFAGYLFEPQRDSILTFRVEPDKGYVYVSGQGKLTTPDKTIITLSDSKKGLIIGNPVRTDSDGFAWDDGFLDKEYSVTQNDIRKVLDTIFVKCVAVETMILEENKGTIRSSGVGDRNGKWQNFSGVSTIKELNIKEGGIIVAVKTVKNEKNMTVGFKVGEGDRKASEILHKLLAEKLAEVNAKKNSQQVAEKPMAKIFLAEAIAKGVVEMQAHGKDSIEALNVKLIKKNQKDVTVVIPVGSYFVMEDSHDTGSYWSTDSVTFFFLGSTESSLDVPVVKYALKPVSPSKETEFFLRTPPTEKIPKLLDLMLKEGMPNESKQLAVWILYNPNLTRDEIDSFYYIRHSGLMFYTEEAVEAEDPIYALTALNRMGFSLDMFKLYTEQVSLVHALGNQNNTVSEFALSELVQLGALDESFLNSKDFRAALLHFSKHKNRSIRYRAILGLEGKVGREIVQALLPLVSDETTIYQFPSIIGLATTRTIRGAAIRLLKNMRDKYENELISLLQSDDYKERLAGIDIFKGSQSKKVNTILAKLSKGDEYKKVREAAKEALGE